MATRPLGGEGALTGFLSFLVGDALPCPEDEEGDGSGRDEGSEGETVPFKASFFVSETEESKFPLSRPVMLLPL